MKSKLRIHAFTLTEVLIALALVAVLLIGISRIFSITSQTIGTGQALSKAVRTQKAIQQTMAADFIGAEPLPGQFESFSGMMPLGGGAGTSAPMLMISNFRVAAYRNADDQRVDITPAVAGEPFTSRSAHIRSVDLDNNGSDADVGELISLYTTGRRNWRVDSIGFFTRGKFTSQTGSNVITGSAVFDTSNYQNQVSSEYAFTWYGHLAVFNGTASRLPWQNSFGLPGMELTQNSTAQPATPPIGEQPNRNNVFADDFLLGRWQMLMIEPTDHDNNTSTEKTVVAPDLTPVYFVGRSWNSPTTQDGVRSPFTHNSVVNVFNNAGTPRDNYKISQTDTLLAPNYNASPPEMRIQMARTDVAGVGAREWYQRLSFLGSTVLNNGDDYRDRWWDGLFARFTTRYQINPYGREASGAPMSSRTFSQRAQLLAEGANQFIVEYAGDFVTQNVNGTVQVLPTPADHDFHPDGIIDFVIVNGVRHTRWYGMPRDVDGDGVIIGNTANGPPPAASPIYDSMDVIPLRDMTGGPMTIQPTPTALPDRRSFEVVVPAKAANYALVTAETNNAFQTPLSNTTVLFAAVDPEDSGYICAWNPIDFETQKPVNTTADAPTARPVPRLIRVIVDVQDRDGKLNEPVRQELVYSVPVTK